MTTLALPLDTFPPDQQCAPHMPTPIWADEDLARFLASPHADVRAWVLWHLAARGGWTLHRAALAQLSGQANQEELEGATELFRQLLREEDVPVPPALEGRQTPRARFVAEFAARLREARAAGTSAWTWPSLKSKEDQDPENHPALTAFATIVRQDPARWFSAFRALVEAGESKQISAAAVKQVAYLAGPEDLAALARWAAAEDEDELRWKAVETSVEAVGSFPEDVELAFDTVEMIVARLEREAPGTSVQRTFSREVLEPLWNVSGDRAAVRRSVADRLVALEFPGDGPFAPAARAGVLLARALLETRSSSSTATNMLVEVLAALARVQRVDALVRAGASLADLGRVHGEQSSAVARALSDCIRDRWATASAEEREGLFSAVMIRLQQGDDIEVSALDLVMDLPGLAAERLLQVCDGAGPDVREEASCAFMNAAERHEHFDPEALPGTIFSILLDACLFVGTRAAAAFLARHWESFLMHCNASEVYEAAVELGVVALAPRIADDWRAGSVGIAQAAALLARLGAAEATLPPGLLADAACRDCAPAGTLVLLLTCRECHRAYWYDVHEAWMDHRVGGVIQLTVGRVVRCRRCGAVDRWELLEADCEQLQTFRAPGEPKLHDGPLQLHDGTVVTRLSEALAQLRAEAQSERTALAWRRFALFAVRSDELEDAVLGLNELVAADPRDVLAPAVLASIEARRGNAESARRAAALAGERFAQGRARPDEHERLQVAKGLIAGAALAASEGLPTALRIGWKVGAQEIIASLAVAGRPPELIDELQRFLASGVVTSVALVEAAVEADEPRLLAQLEARKRARSLRPAPSRNAPCPCGSGEKYKKCCGR